MEQPPAGKNENTFYTRFWRYTFSPTAGYRQESPIPTAVTNGTSNEANHEELDDSGATPLRRSLSFDNLPKGIDGVDVLAKESEKGTSGDKLREKIELERARPKSVDNIGELRSPPPQSPDTGIRSPDNAEDAEPTFGIVNSPLKKSAPVTTLMPSNARLAMIACKNEKDIKGGIQLKIRTLHSSRKDINIAFDGNTLYEKTLLATISRSVHEATSNEHETSFPAPPPNLISFSKNQPFVSQLGWEKVRESIKIFFQN